MPKLVGRKALVYNGATKIGSLREYVINVESTEIDADDHDNVSGWGETENGTKRWNAPLQLLYLDTDVNQRALFDALVADTILTIKFRPNGDGAGKTEISSTCQVGTWSLSAPLNDMQAVNCTLRGKSALAFGTQP
jgi:predicted secreted protein